ncbi:hypothetical protein Q31b_05400 [Novipirellula aureliae]|uniref:Uncharacterized protein n=1 Tax=Novipirellula aureliae TaxID=2527966 RepID=A0A5C6E958_9BACT|nr:hypothetical protein [Novipirellula aureliae]TWU45368.1 hypothetical protein Q31b_05400 [Novipirellula aureliae]
MKEEYHGWDVHDDNSNRFNFANIAGEKRGLDTFVITDFGKSTNVRQAVSAMLAATKQFHCKLHVQRSEQAMAILTELSDARMLKMAPVRSNENDEIGVMSIRATPPPPPRPWWKFWG